MLRLFFVRHGRTSWNAEGRVQGGGGWDGVGRMQAAALGEHLRSEHFDAIYASPALRDSFCFQEVGEPFANDFPPVPLSLIHI